MKKIIAVLAVLLIACSAAAVWLMTHRTIEDKNARFAAQAMETGDYERARKLYSYAINGGSADDEDMQMYKILCAYLDAKDALVNEKFSEGLDILNALQYNFSGLLISEDIDGLRIRLAHGLSVDDRLDALEKAVRDNSRGSAEKIYEEISGLELTSKQMDRFFSIRRLMIDHSEDHDEPVISSQENEDEELPEDDDAETIPEDEDEPVQTNYTVRIEVDELPDGALNIHSGPGASYSVSGTIDSVMILTIVEETNGWGRLKSGAGWIELRYCTRN